MPYPVECFRNVAENDSYFLPRIQSMTKSIIKIGKLVNGGVAGCEIRLKRSYVIVTKMVFRYLKTRRSRALSMLLSKEMGL